MTNTELQELLKMYPGELPVMLLASNGSKHEMIEFTEENILHTSKTAKMISVPEDGEPEDGEVDLGDGEQYLLLNPLIL